MPITRNTAFHGSLLSGPRMGSADSLRQQVLSRAAQEYQAHVCCANANVFILYWTWLTCPDSWLADGVEF